ncbi:MAG TPA: response regulator transcription factor [Blastocatellia bacterium]|nr:response regulator transcription factor [Blastocatellia bacterium]
MRVLIADDHAIVRHGLKQILQAIPSITQIGEAKDGHEALTQARAQTWDLVMLDLTLPDKNGLEVLKQLKREAPQTPVLVLSMLPEDQYGVSVLKAGASGYLPKESAPEELAAAIHKVLRGGKYISLNLAEHLAFDFSPGTEQALHKTLSDREFQVLCLIASGKTNSQIAEYLAISVKTVSTYRTRILGKMKMQSNAELTNYAFRHKLVH